MIETSVLTVCVLLFLLITTIIIRAIIKKQKVIGEPPIPVFYFVLAKLLVLVNLAFLLMRGLNVKVDRIFKPDVFIDIIALAFLLAGTVLLFLSTIQLNKDLIFGLSSSDNHTLQSKGVYSLSRHPFYLGFIFILFSSCLLLPHYLNILAFAGTWIIHHFIMIKEEQFLRARYGITYEQYAGKVKRYLTI